METTLRTPYVLKHAFRIFIVRFCLRFFVFVLGVYLLTGSLLFSLIVTISTYLVVELAILSNWYEKILPRHLSNHKHVEALYSKRNEYANSQLVKIIEESVKLSSWGLVYIGYVGLAAKGWEIIFKYLYHLIARTDVPYQNLLVGFKNKAIESDQAFWKVAQISNKDKQKEALEEYLEEYGSKVEDLEIAKPTLRERPDTINQLLNIYSDTKPPYSVLKKSKKKRLSETEKVREQLRIPRGMFDGVLKMVQKNVALREDRRHYHFVSDYYIRQMILLLARRLKIAENVIFTISWRNIKNEVDQRNTS